MEFLTGVGIVLLVIGSMAGLFFLTVAFWIGLEDGWGDARLMRQGYSGEHLAEQALKHPVVIWHGWYTAYSVRTAWMDWKDRNDFEERRDERRMRAVEKRDNRRRKVLDKRGV